MKKLLVCWLLFPVLAFAQLSEPKPDSPVEKWTGKTIMLIGAHADDDAARWRCFRRMEIRSIS